jgi:ABC-type phosphate transport system substrate-binding protein
MLRLNIRTSLLSSCAAAVLALGASNGAHAQSAANPSLTQVSGGGSTLAAVIYQQIFNAIQNNLDPTVQWNYAAVGSGAGARAVLCDDTSQVIITALNQAPPNNTAIGPYQPTNVDFGASDNPLSATQIADWGNSSNGGTGSSCVGSVTAGTGTGQKQGGPLLQLPTIGTPVTIATNTPHNTLNGFLTFTDQQLCGIFSGAITTWTDSRLSGIVAPGTSPVKTPSGQIEVVYRSDGSGTSALLTAHLAAVCQSTSVPPGFKFTSTQTFASLFASGFPAGSHFVGASGSPGVQTTIGLNSTGPNESIGYLSPDYTQAAPANNSKVTQFAPVATLVNSHNSTPYSPSYSAVSAALAQAKYPSGATHPTSGTDFVPTVPDPTVGYPIAGYTTMILPSCYADPAQNVAFDIDEFFAQITGTPDYITLIQAQGFLQLPASIVADINNDIFSTGATFGVASSANCQYSIDWSNTLNVSFNAGNPYPGR